MKAIFSIIISGALVVSGFGQTRNVLIGTNNAVVQPTNFWSADASNARAGLGLGSAATNPASAFQPSSATLSNLVSGNGGALTNLQATNLVGLIPSSNIPSISLTNIGGTLSVSSGGTGATNASSARINLGATTIGDALFISTNSESARLIIGALATNGDAVNLTNFPSILLRTNGSASGLTNFPSEVFALSNATGFLLLSQGGTGATNAAAARTNLGLGTAATNSSSAFQPASTVLSNLASSNGVNLTNLQASNVTGTIAISNGGSGAITAGGARTNLELGATNNVVFNSLHAEQDASSVVYTLSLGQTNTGFRGTGGGANDFVFARNGTNVLGLTSGNIQSFVGHSFSAPLTLNYGAGNTAVIAFAGIDSATGAAISRTNLGLGWSALTNTTASGFQTALFGTGTNPVLVNTNGEVVSPTNFWQEAPITTTFIESQPTTNSSTNISPSRLLHIHSLATNIVNTTNTIVLPTNTLTFEGDIALVVHKGPTNSLTQVRQAGSTNNLITLNKFNEAVEFTYYNDNWQFLETASFTAPIYFSGTNAAANAAESRTNLGIPLPAFTNTNNANFRTAIELGATNNVTFNNVAASGTLTVTGSVTALSNAAVGGTLTSTGVVTAMTNLNVGGAIAVTNAALTRTNLGLGAADNVSIGSDGGSLTTDDFNAATINVSGSIAFTNAATTRTNLGLPLAALTNTNNAGFQGAIFQTNTTPTNGANLGDAKAWIEISVVTNSVTNSYRIPVFQ